MDVQKKLTKRGRFSRNYRKIKANLTSGAIRAATLDMKIDNTGFFSKKDIEYFKHRFFPQKNPLPYSRLSNSLSKIMCCQYVLHNHPDVESKKASSYPFVFRLSNEMNLFTHEYHLKKIQRKLSSVLDRTPLYWMTTEYKTMQEKSGKHFNGEILLYSGELDIVEQAFKELFGLYDINPNTKQPILNADGTKKQKKALRHAIDFPIASRNKQAKLHGEFYAVYNWPSYSIKYAAIRKYERRTGNSDKKGESFHYISAELNKLASAFHAEHIRTQNL